MLDPDYIPDFLSVSYDYVKMKLYEKSNSLTVIKIEKIVCR